MFKNIINLLKKKEKVVYTVSVYKRSFVKGNQWYWKMSNTNTSAKAVYSKYYDTKTECLEDAKVIADALNVAVTIMELDKGK